MVITHISQEQYYRKPFGAVPCNTMVLLRCVYSEKPSSPCLKLRCETENSCNELSLCIENISVNGNNFTGEMMLSNNTLQRPGVYFYSFSCEEGSSQEFQITVYENDLYVPEWFLNTVIYQIFPDRFYKAEDKNVKLKPNSFMYSDWNDMPMYIKNSLNEVIRWEFFGGNLKGVECKIPYIQYVGADTIYLNPIFEAQSNHRYDTADYYKIDPLLGGDEAFDSLLADLKKHGMHIVLDGVFNHTGRHSKYFSQCRESSSPYKDWYEFKEDGTYNCWWGVEDLPAVKKDSESFENFAANNENSVVKYWSRKGIDGWRLDVADELTDRFIQKIRAAAESEIAEPVIIGEVWEDASNKISYGSRRMYFTEKELHTHTNYIFRNTFLSYFKGEISAETVVKIFCSIKENYPKHNFYAQVNMTGSHDTERLMTVMLYITRNDRFLARNLVKCYSLIQFTSPGVPLIYYGDESCLEGGEDPDNRRTYPWGNEDKEIIEWFSEMAFIRRNNEVLIKGGIEYFHEDDGNVFAFLRVPEDGAGRYFMTVCDRFARGRSFLEKYVCRLIKAVENLSEKRYIIEKEAGGYAVLASFF